MNTIDFTMYKPSDLEAWITTRYLSHGIVHPNDLTIQTVSYLFDVDVRYYDGPCFAEWSDAEGYAFIFLDNKKTPVEQKYDFFHELCHPLRHVGTQDKLPELFQDLQEIQAAQFQPVAALPAYLLQQVPLEPQWSNYIHAIAETFGQPNQLVEARMRQVIARIEQEERDQTMRACELQRSVEITYSEATHKILDQLYRQVAERRGTYHVGY